MKIIIDKLLGIGIPLGAMWDGDKTRAYDVLD